MENTGFETVQRQIKNYDNLKNFSTLVIFTHLSKSVNLIYKIFTIYIQNIRMGNEKIKLYIKQ